LEVRQAKPAKGGFAIFELQSAVNEIASFGNVNPIPSTETEARSKLGA
jgi:hypothetical protein